MLFSKVIEIRDRMTFIPALATRIEPLDTSNDQERWLLECAGYTSRAYGIVLTHLQTGESHADPFEWKSGRTMQVVHQWLMLEYVFQRISAGEVVDVEVLLGESTVRKTSQRGESHAAI